MIIHHPNRKTRYLNLKEKLTSDVKKKLHITIKLLTQKKKKNVNEKIIIFGLN